MLPRVASSHVSTEVQPVAGSQLVRMHGRGSEQSTLVYTHPVASGLWSGSHLDVWHLSVGHRDVRFRTFFLTHPISLEQSSFWQLARLSSLSQVMVSLWHMASLLAALSSHHWRRHLLSSRWQSSCS